jgi:hypothetical protein
MMFSLYLFLRSTKDIRLNTILRKAGNQSTSVPIAALIAF